MEPITPPNDYFNKLPQDLKNETFLKLSYEEIIDKCRLNKSFNTVCNDPFFWETKLKNDFPEANIPKLKGIEYKAFYEHLLSLKYEKIKNELKENINNDPRIFKLNKEIKEMIVNNKTGRQPNSKNIGPYLMQAKRIPGAKSILEERRNLYKQLENEAEKYQIRADELNNKYRKVFPIIYTPKYFLINHNDPNLEDKIYPMIPPYTTINVDKPLDKIGITEENLNKFLFPYIHEPVKEGYIIYFDPEDPELYRVVLYVYSFNNRLYGEISGIRDERPNFETLPEHLQARFEDENAGAEFDRLYPNFNTDW